MLTIRVGSTDAFDESTSEFVKAGGVALNLEHSLLSLSKWESIYEKPFFEKADRSAEEVLTYIKCMCVDDNIPPEVFQQLSEENVDTINAYLNAKRSATWLSDPDRIGPSREQVTSELIYYWMTAFRIPFECERWNLNRLLTLIRICNLKQDKPKKKSRGEIARRNRELNAKRKAQLGTTG
jgi:hypothetical protein